MDKKDNMIVNQESLAKKIYIIRGEEVLLDVSECSRSQNVTLNKVAGRGSNIKHNTHSLRAAEDPVESFMTEVTDQTIVVYKEYEIRLF